MVSSSFNPRLSALGVRTPTTAFEDPSPYHRCADPRVDRPGLYATAAARHDNKSADHAPTDRTAARGTIANSYSASGRRRRDPNCHDGALDRARRLR